MLTLSDLSLDVLTAKKAKYLERARLCRAASEPRPSKQKPTRVGRPVGESETTLRSAEKKEEAVLGGVASNKRKNVHTNKRVENTHIEGRVASTNVESNMAAIVEAAVTEPVVVDCRVRSQEIYVEEKSATCDENEENNFTKFSENTEKNTTEFSEYTENNYTQFSEDTENQSTKYSEEQESQSTKYSEESESKSTDNLTSAADDVEIITTGAESDLQGQSRSSSEDNGSSVLVSAGSRDSSTSYTSNYVSEEEEAALMATVEVVRQDSVQNLTVDDSWSGETLPEHASVDHSGSRLTADDVRGDATSSDDYNDFYLNNSDVASDSEGDEIEATAPPAELVDPVVPGADDIALVNSSDTISSLNDSMETVFLSSREFARSTSTEVDLTKSRDCELGMARPIEDIEDRGSILSDELHSNSDVSDISSLDEDCKTYSFYDTPKRTNNDRRKKASLSRTPLKGSFNSIKLKLIEKRARNKKSNDNSTDNLSQDYSNPMKNVTSSCNLQEYAVEHTSSCSLTLLTKSDSQSSGLKFAKAKRIGYLSSDEASETDESITKSEDKLEVITEAETDIDESGIDIDAKVERAQSVVVDEANIARVESDVSYVFSGGDSPQLEGEEPASVIDEISRGEIDETETAMRICFPGRSTEIEAERRERLTAGNYETMITASGHIPADATRFEERMKQLAEGGGGVDGGDGVSTSSYDTDDKVTRSCSSTSHNSSTSNDSSSSHDSSTSSDVSRTNSCSCNDCRHRSCTSSYSCSCRGDLVDVESSAATSLSCMDESRTVTYNESSDLSSCLDDSHSGDSESESGTVSGGSCVDEASLTHDYASLLVRDQQLDVATSTMEVSITDADIALLLTRDQQEGGLTYAPQPIRAATEVGGDEGVETETGVSNADIGVDERVREGSVIREGSVMREGNVIREGNVTIDDVSGDDQRVVPIDGGDVSFVYSEADSMYYNESIMDSTMDLRESRPYPENSGAPTTAAAFPVMTYGRDLIGMSGVRSDRLFEVRRWSGVLYL